VNEVLKIFLSLSFSGALAAALLFAVKPLYKKRLSKTWQYYIWVVVLLRMVLPFAPPVNLIGLYTSSQNFSGLSQRFGLARYLRQYTSSYIISTNGLSGAEQGNGAGLSGGYNVIVTPGSQTASENSGIIANGAFKINNIEGENPLTSTYTSMQILCCFIPLTSLFLLLSKIVRYRIYTKHILSGAKELIDTQTLEVYADVCANLGIKNPLPVLLCKHADTPMLIGIFKPRIVLPHCCLKPNHLQMIFCHELTHYKRNDILFKWLVQIIVCMHWFNPVSYIILWEIAKNCELSCDEAVLSRLSSNEKILYGDAIVAQISAKVYKKTAFSAAMSRDGKVIKERLVFIKQYSRTPVIFAKLASFVLSAAVITGAFFAGVYAETGASREAENSLTATLYAGYENSGDKTINVWSYASEMEEIANRFKEMNPNSEYKVDVTVIPFSIETNYEKELETALAAGGSNAPDIYTAEAQTVYNHVNVSGYAASYENLGINTNYLLKESGTAKYAADIGTNKNGELVALPYESTGGVFVYNRSIAEDVWGTDNPKVIAAIIGPGWDKFLEAANSLKAKGYSIVSGLSDVWVSAGQSAEKPWIYNGELYIDPKRAEFLEVAKKLKDGGFTNDTLSWTDEWFIDMRGEGKSPVFGFFGPQWFIDYTLEPNCYILHGDWLACEPTAPFWLGGSWVFANKNTNETAGVKNFLEWLLFDTTETGFQRIIANERIDKYTPSKLAPISLTVMENTHATRFVLGGQNLYDELLPATQKVSASSFGAYDEEIESIWFREMYLYTEGKSYDKVLEDFKKEAQEIVDAAQKS
jgi:beta-lactamase regulating signal transducer with metallopeptidase domain